MTQPTEKEPAFTFCFLLPPSLPLPFPPPASSTEADGVVFSPLLKITVKSSGEVGLSAKAASSLWLFFLCANGVTEAANHPATSPPSMS